MHQRVAASERDHWPTDGLDAVIAAGSGLPGNVPFSYKDLASPATCLCHCDQMRQMKQECTELHGMQCNSFPCSTAEPGDLHRLTERTCAISVAHLNWFSPPSSCPLVPGRGVTVTTTDGTYWMHDRRGSRTQAPTNGLLQDTTPEPPGEHTSDNRSHAKRHLLCMSTNSNTRCAGWQRYKGWRL